MTDPKARLFVAVEVPARVRDGIEPATEPLRRRQPEARWVEPSAFHLTLAFVGWLDDEKSRAVEKACAEAAGSVGPFDLALSGRAGTFGSGVLWAGMEHSPELDRLAGAVRQALADRDLLVETRPFHGHLTLARAARGARIHPGLAQAYEGPRLSWRVERLALMRSRLRRAGARYSVEAAWPLGRGGGASGADG